MSAPTYNIEKISDFHAIPADRLDDCIADFAYWLHVCRKHAELTAAATTMLGAPATFCTDTMQWCDDGIRGISELNVVCEGKTIATIPIRP
jgi:hypothetical protein